MRGLAVSGKIICMVLAVAWIVLSFASAVRAEEGEMLPVRTNAEKTVAIIPVDASSVQALNNMIDRLSRGPRLRSVTVVVSTVGASPELVIMGRSPFEVEKAVSLFQEVLTHTNRQQNLVVISASLRQLSDGDMKSVGINPIPSVNVTAVRSYQKVQFQNDYSNPNFNFRQDMAQIAATAVDVVRLNEALAKSKILVSSEVYTPNGIQGKISNIQRIPIFTTDKNGNVNTDYQNLETSIDVTPTVIHYDPDRPEESEIRMDVTLKVSVVSGYRRLNTISAPEYTVKYLHSSQVLKADGVGSVVGTFVSDEILKAQSGVPVLSGLPILKYLFSQETSEKVRNYAVLTVSVRLLPEEQEVETK